MAEEKKIIRMLRCKQCGKKYAYDSVSRVCADCGGRLVETWVITWPKKRGD